MTDLEITKLCAEAMGYTDITEIEFPNDPKRYVAALDSHGRGLLFNPFEDDAQVMGMVKRFGLALWGNDHGTQAWKWHAEEQLFPDDQRPAIGHGETANRAVCECVAEIQQANSDFEKTDE
mgnify:CR=1 FL=1